MLITYIILRAFLKLEYSFERVSNVSDDVNKRGKNNRNRTANTRILKPAPEWMEWTVNRLICWIPAYFIIQCNRTLVEVMSHSLEYKKSAKVTTFLWKANSNLTTDLTLIIFQFVYPKKRMNHGTDGNESNLITKSISG